MVQGQAISFDAGGPDGGLQFVPQAFLRGHGQQARLQPLGCVKQLCPGDQAGPHESPSVLVASGRKCKSAPMQLQLHVRALQRAAPRQLLFREACLPVPVLFVHQCQAFLEGLDSSCQLHEHVFRQRYRGAHAIAGGQRQQHLAFPHDVARLRGATDDSAHRRRHPRPPGCGHQNALCLLLSSELKPGGKRCEPDAGQRCNGGHRVRRHRAREKHGLRSRLRKAIQHFLAKEAVQACFAHPRRAPVTVRQPAFAPRPASWTNTPRARAPSCSFRPLRQAQHQRREEPRQWASRDQPPLRSAAACDRACPPD